MAFKIFEDSRLTPIADAIRSKDRTTDPIRVGDMADRIEDIPNYHSRLQQWIDRSIEEITEDDVAGITLLRGYTFHHCLKLRKCVLPDGLTILGGGEFYNCLALESIKIPNTVTQIGGDIFTYCKTLKSLVLPDSVVSIKEPLAYGCTSLTELRFSENITSIPNRTASNCTSLPTIVIPAKVLSIGAWAFYGCNKLTTIECRATTPPTLADATSLPGTSIVKYIYVPAASVDAYKAAPYWSDYADKIYGSKFELLVCRNDLNALTADDFAGVTKVKDYGCISSSIKSLELSNTIDTIGAIAFYSNTNLTKIVVPDSVTVIGENNRGGGFAYCDNVTKLVLGKNLNTIYYDSFGYCTKLTTVVIHAETPIAISDTTFLNDPLEHIYVPTNAVEAYKSSSYWALYTDIIEAITDDVDEDTVGRPGTLWDKKGLSYWLRTTESIDANDFVGSTNGSGYGFQNFKNLTDVNLSNHKAVYMGSCCFERCTALTHVVFPSTYTSISRNMFQGCTALTTFEIRATTPPIMYADVFTGCSNLKYIYVPADSVTAYKTASGWSDYADIIYGSKFAHFVSGEVTHITADDFYGVTSSKSILTSYNTALKSVEFPNTMNAIGTSGFYGCTGLTKVIIPDSIGIIGSNNTGSSFYECSNLSYVAIGTGCHTIYEYSFYRSNTSIPMTIICKAETPPALGNDALPRAVSGIVQHIYVPSASVDAYKTANRWSDYASVIEAITSDTDVDTTSRAPKLVDEKLCKWLKRETTEVKEADLYNITTIHKDSFAYYYSLKHVVLPNTIIAIGAEAFYDNTALTTVELRSTTPPTLGGNAFLNCTALKYIYVPADSVEAYKTASGWSAYADIIYGSKFAHIVSREVTALTADDFASTTVTAIRDGVCLGNTNLTSLEIPSLITVLGASSFRSCEKLKEVIIPDNVEVIGLNNANQTFRYCANVERIVIGTGVHTVYPFSFCNEASMTTLICKATTPPAMNGSTPFDACPKLLNIYVPTDSVDTYKAADGWSTYATLISAIPDDLKIDTTARAGTAWDTLTLSYTSRTLTNITADMFGSITQIGAWAFFNLDALITVEIPATVTKIGELAFYNCYNMTTFTCHATTPPTFGSQMFDSCSKLAHIYVPSASVDTYKTASGWSDYASIIEAIPSD